MQRLPHSGMIGTSYQRSPRFVGSRLSHQQGGTSGRKKKAEYVAESVGPGVFVVQATENALVHQRTSRLPSLLDQDAEKQIRVAQVMCALSPT